jgi:peptidoglycan/LPS O-acetylase OafA/YrhL
MVAVSAFPGHGLEVDHPLFRPLGAVYAFIGVWLVHAAATGRSRIVGSRVMVFFGTISYALYLWHQTLINGRLLGEHSTPRNLLLIAVAIVASWLSWVLVERPVGRLRGRLRLDRPSARQQAYAASHDADAGDREKEGPRPSTSNV